MKYIKSIMLSLVLVAVAATGYNSVASAAGKPVAPTNVKVYNMGSHRLSCTVNVSWSYSSRVDYFTVAVNGNRVVTTGSKSAQFTVLTDYNNQIAVRAWLNGTSSDPATRSFYCSH